MTGVCLLNLDLSKANELRGGGGGEPHSPA